MEATHVQNKLVSTWGLVSQGRRNSVSLDTCPTLKSSMSRLVPLLLWPFHFQLQSKTKVLSLANRHLRLELKMDINNPPKRGGGSLTLNQAPQSLGTCQGWRSYFLGLPNLVWEVVFSTCVASPSREPRLDVGKGVNFYNTYREGGHTREGMLRMSISILKSRYCYFKLYYLLNEG